MTQLSVLKSRLVYFWCIRITCPTYAATSVITVSNRWHEIFANMKSQLTPRCRTPKVSKVGTFLQYLRVTTFWGFKIYTQKYMTLRDFDNFLFPPWIFWFLCASLHATVFAKKWCKTKWSCFYINERAFVIVTTFVCKKHYFSNFLCFVSRLIHPRNN